MIVTILTQFGVGGLIFAPKAVAFKGSRINPLSGLKRMFSVKALVELGKSILKVVFLFGIGFVVIVYFMPGIVWFPNGTMANALNMMTSLIPSLIGGLLIGLFIIAVLDFAWQRYDFMKQMRMSRQDQKEEFKQTEGSPEVKAKIRRMQMEASANASKQREALSQVGEATAVITNPTHFAVALKYEVGSAARRPCWPWGAASWPSRLSSARMVPMLPCSKARCWRVRFSSPVRLVGKSRKPCIMRLPWCWPIFTVLIREMSQSVRVSMCRAIWNSPKTVSCLRSNLYVRSSQSWVIG